jgi:para-nitrobenzyl esterase
VANLLEWTLGRAVHEVVTVSSGRLRGRKVGSVYAFLGVPYAAAPTGANRFGPPVAPTPWPGERDTSTYGARAPQPSDEVQFLPDSAAAGDEYLNVNIFTPEFRNARLPVLVWFHGGGFVTGSNASPWYRGENFARDGVVMVSVNYRLGVEGFLQLENAPANRGILDCIAALEWVRDNISAFGGDPSQVTIAGQSSGGMACASLLGARQAHGLFGGVGLLSGAIAKPVSSERATDLAERFAAELGIRPTREAFAAVPAESLLEVQNRLARLRSPITPDPIATAQGIVEGVLRLGPIADGELVPASSMHAFTAPMNSDVRIMVGNTSDEFRMLSRSIPDKIKFETAEATLVTLGLSIQKAESLLSQSTCRTRSELLLRAFSDRAFRVPSIRVAEARARSTSPAFLYEFDWAPPKVRGVGGAGHTVDVPFFFDALDAPGVMSMLGSDPPQDVAETVHSAWVRFVSTGAPSWPSYDLARRSTMVFGSNSRVIEDSGRETTQTWEDVTI